MPQKSYFLLFLILIAALFVRIWRVDEILGFYYDQGRDGKVIWELLHQGKFFLIGPTTGIEGIFRGPWYYWLITPFYWLGGGNPVWPSIFLAFTTVLAITLVFFIGKSIGGIINGLTAIIIASFSFYLVYASRWLSNPTPMFLISMILVGSMFLVMEGKRWAWIFIFLMLGLAMQFGSAAEIFYFPAVLIFAIWQKKNLPKRKNFLLGVSLLFLTFLPQIIFDLRHDGILAGAIKKFFFEEKSFYTSALSLLESRLQTYYSVFSSKIFPTDILMIKVFSFLSGLILIFNLKKLWSNQRFVSLLILLIVPMFGLFLFKGNYGVLYDYYFTGYYLIFVLIFSTVLTSVFTLHAGKVILSLFLFVFLQDNLFLIKNYLSSDTNDASAIFFGNQKEAVDWVYKDSRGKEFSVDVYVPPVIPHAYDYLFLWWGTVNYAKTPTVDHETPLVYTLYEEDPPHPERLEAWLARQKGIATIDHSVRFGAITVERRYRTR